MKPPQREYALSFAVRSGSKYCCQSKRSGGTSLMASTRLTMLPQNVRRSPAPGRMQPIPTIAMSAGAWAGSPATSTAAGAWASRWADEPSASSRCRPATVVTPSRSAATWPIMYMPCRHWSSAPTATSLDAPGAGAGSRSTPLLAIRRRPMLSTSSAWRTSCAGCPACTRRRFSAANSSANGDGRQRVAWPGPLSRNTVRSQARAASWKPEVIAPDATASS